VSRSVLLPRQATSRAAGRGATRTRASPRGFARARCGLRIFLRSPRCISIPPSERSAPQKKRANRLQVREESPQRADTIGDDIRHVDYGAADVRSWDKPLIVLLRSAYRLLVSAEERFCIRTPISPTLVRAVLRLPQLACDRKCAVRPLRGGLRKCLTQSLIELAEPHWMTTSSAKLTPAVDLLARACPPVLFTQYAFRKEYAKLALGTIEVFGGSHDCAQAAKSKE
jgi:hypothetical protein